MAKKNWYVVKKGKTPGVYSTWEECREQVLGFPGGIYKGFVTKEEAEKYAGSVWKDISEQKKAEEKNFLERSMMPENDEAVAYVDGSYNGETGDYSCGVVFFFKGKKKQFAKKGTDKKLAEMRNVAGEIMGAEMAMREAVKLGVSYLTIVHDYQGVASWCTGEWKTNKEGTKAYKAYFDSIQGLIDIRFEKVKGHSGDKYNELADSLAKSVIF